MTGANGQHHPLLAAQGASCQVRTPGSWPAEERDWSVTRHQPDGGYGAPSRPLPLQDRQSYPAQQLAIRPHTWELQSVVSLWQVCSGDIQRSSIGWPTAQPWKAAIWERERWNVCTLAPGRVSRPSSIADIEHLDAWTQRATNDTRQPNHPLPFRARHLAMPSDLHLIDK